MRLLSRLLTPTPRVTERDTVSVMLADGRHLDILRVRDPRAKRLRLSFDERGARLTLPMRASRVAGDRFVHEHRDWLARQLDSHAHADLPTLVRGITAVLPLRDALVPLSWDAGRYSCLKVIESDEVAGLDAGLVFQLPARAGDIAMRRALRDFYEAQARADVGRWLPAYLPGLPRAPTQIRFKMMSSQWGSLAPNGTLVLDLSLVLAEPAAFEYVLVHELCHLIHADHSPAFWREVGMRCPQWRHQRDYFQHEGRRLKATLRQLLSA